MNRKEYENGVGKKIFGPSKLNYEHFSEVI